jgi:hypothetical protein
LQDRCDLLQSPARDTPPRHRTLAQAIRWSVDLLNDNESALFRALAVFSGGWTIEAAQSVFGAQDSDVLVLLRSLLDKSLIYREPDADSHPEPRYGMLQTLRAYALELLEFHREADDCRRQHAAHFLEFAERIHPALLRSPDKSLVDDIGRDHANSGPRSSGALLPASRASACASAPLCGHTGSAAASSRMAATSSKTCSTPIAAAGPLPPVLVR